ncbi:MAG: DUF4296 domain-containing protein [Chitinophagaceae bacterium]|nr:DUF4296 domain-containing protein [Chitinophagaceae bacterium]
MFACSGKEKTPSHVLPPEKMKFVLWDLMRADQFLSDYVFRYDTSKNKKKESLTLYAEIFKTHHIKPAQFLNSFDYYTKHPGKMKKIFDSLAVLSPYSPAQNWADEFKKKTISTEDSLGRKNIKPYKAE